MITNLLVKVTLANLILTLLILPLQAKIGSIIQGSPDRDNDAKFPTSTCCVVPTCEGPNRCYQTLTCGYMCSTGKYPPAEYSRTPGYRLKDSYRQYDCRFGDCRNYDFTCSHCQNPRDESFSIYLVRQDCKDCYTLDKKFEAF